MVGENLRGKKQKRVNLQFPTLRDATVILRDGTKKKGKWIFPT